MSSRLVVERDLRAKLSDAQLAAIALCSSHARPDGGHVVFTAKGGGLVGTPRPPHDTDVAPTMAYVTAVFDAPWHRTSRGSAAEAFAAPSAMCSAAGGMAGAEYLHGLQSSASYQHEAVLQPPTTAAIGELMPSERAVVALLILNIRKGAPGRALPG